MSLHLSQSVFNSRNSNQDLDSFPGWATSLDASLEISDTQLMMSGFLLQFGLLWIKVYLYLPLPKLNKLNFIFCMTGTSRLNL